MCVWWSGRRNEVMIRNRLSISSGLIYSNYSNNEIKVTSILYLSLQLVKRKISILIFTYGDEVYVQSSSVIWMNRFLDWNFRHLVTPRSAQPDFYSQQFFSVFLFFFFWLVGMSRKTERISYAFLVPDWSTETIDKERKKLHKCKSQPRFLFLSVTVLEWNRRWLRSEDDDY